jgi:hypothetical protein
MTRRSIREYAAAIRPRYLRASKPNKAIILNEFCQTTGYRRKSAIRLLHRSPQEERHPSGRPRTYGPDVVAALGIAWEATDHLCGKRLAPFLPELVPILERHQELVVSSTVRTQLLSISAATVDRLLATQRATSHPRPYTQSRAQASLQALIPIRTWADWEGVTVGYLEVDLVHHCAETTEGFYLTSLVGVDIVTGWTACVPIWGKGQSRVGGGVDHIRRHLPFLLCGVDSDNGGEFLNQVLYDYSQRHHIEFTRSRPYKKNDQAHVEQKNWSVVRRLIGYDRYTTKAAYQVLEELYPLICQYSNFFQPLRKVVTKERHGAKVTKRFDQAQTPYQRLLASKVLTAPQQQILAALYERLNPCRLRADIDAGLERLWQLAERTAEAPTASASPPTR